MKRYYEDSYTVEFDALVSHIEPDRLYLSHTYFYPESGGQPSDWGMINDQMVRQVILENDDRIAHAIKNPHQFQVGQTVHGQIDWDRRFDHMQQHSGQHLLSGLLNLYFQASTISFHLGSELSTIDIHASNPVNPDEIEDILNRHILMGIPITATLYAEHEQIPDITLRKPPKVERNIRIVTIGDIDSSPCGGTHLRNTSELQIGKIISIEPYKKGYRLGFVFGRRALQLFSREHSIIQDLTRLTSSPFSELPLTIQNLLLEKTKLRGDLDRLLDDVYRQRTESLIREAQIKNRTRIIIACLDATADYLKRTSLFLSETPSMIALLYNRDGAFVLLTNCEPAIDGRSLISQETWKGGGTPKLVQGRFIEPESLQAIIHRVSTRIMNTDLP
ncbi:MAG: alanyl-tRNA editing protein [Candidatus Delongbacteria bacterium]|nr:alanyl-tRNA editing protein [Candidatus Delongbacteria bacterium]